MRKEPKVILVIIALASILSGCSLFVHLDGSTPEERGNFRTGRPTSYEASRLMLISRMKKEREEEILAERNRAWHRDGSSFVALKASDGTQYAQAPETTEPLAIANYRELSEPVAVSRIEEVMPEARTTQQRTASSAAGTETAAAGATGSGVWADPASSVAVVAYTGTDEAAYDSKTQEDVRIVSPLTVAALWGTAGGPGYQGDGSRDSVKVLSPVTIAALWGASEKGTPARKSTMGSPRLKIVSGDGLPLSAKLLTGRIQQMGYEVEMIDVAPFRFDKETVFYARGFKDRARDIAKELDAGGGIRPISWESVYDIIVVSVNTASN